MPWFGNKKEKKVPTYVEMLDNTGIKESMVKKRKQEDDTLELWLNNYTNVTVAPFPPNTFTTQTNDDITWGGNYYTTYSLFGDLKRKPHAPRQCDFEEGII